MEIHSTMHSWRKIAVLAWFLTLMPISIIHATDISWRNIGPGGGGWVQSIVCDPHDPNTTYLGSDVGGFYYTENGGKTWSTQNNGLKDYFIECIAVHPENSHIILLGTQGGIFKSIDRGKTWELKRKGFPALRKYSYSAPIGALAFNPTNPNIVYAGIGRPRWKKGGRGEIFKSEDCGENWFLCTTARQPSADAIVSDIEIASDGSYILAVTNKGVYRSEDNGKTWVSSNNGLPHRCCEEAAISPSNPTICYLTLKTMARDDEVFNGGIYRSNDGGKTWVPRCKILRYKVGKREDHPLKTTNYKEIVVHPEDPDIVYVGANSWVTPGIYKTFDGGSSWEYTTIRSASLENMDYGWITQWGPSVTCLTISMTDPDTLYFGTAGHVFTTQDGGRSWMQRYCQMLPNRYFKGNGLETTVAVNAVFDPHDPKRLYFCYADIMLLITDSFNDSYYHSFKGMNYKDDVTDVIIDPTDVNKIWACTGTGKYGNVCRSRDRGKTWHVVGNPASGLPEGRTKNLLLDPNSSAGRRTLYVACSGYGIYKSLNDGLSWVPVNNGLPEAARGKIVDLVMNPKDSNQLRCLLGTSPPKGSGVYQTVDGGMNWERITSPTAPFADVQDLAVDPNNWDTLYICQRERYDTSLKCLFRGGLLKSIDSGKTWRHIYDFHFTKCLAISTVNSNVLYLGTTDHPYHDDNKAQGLLKSTDGGKTWHKENNGLSCTKVNSISISPHNPTIIVLGTSGNGFFIGMDNSLSN